MKLIAAFLIALVLGLSAYGQSSEINIIPKPRLVRPESGSFSLSRQTTIIAKAERERRGASALNAWLQRNYGFSLRVTGKPQSKNYIEFAPPTLTLDHTMNTGVGYGMRVSPDRIRIEGYEKGHFFAIQSLVQLLPIEFKEKAEIPSVLIIDEPRFPYRGMHLDISRHFQPVDFIKKYIDLMAMYKFNTFHWHLTDDQGWRIEIKKYPRLTEIGSKRPETVKERNLQPYIGDGIPVEGFYTQEQIKDVVRYAKERYITVIPEIELPGHASAALAAYPQFGCKTDHQYKVQTTWGIFKETFCPTDETFKFLEDVLTETIELFPDSPYVHIGGDEVLKDHWKESAFVQELKKKENLKDEHEVQSYFVRRIEKFINSKGKKIIGWDEILEGGIAPNATIMSWRGEKGGIEAARARHDVIMTPNTYAYFDYGQGDPAYEPLNIGSYIPLSKVYGWDPVPKELNDDEKKFILGGQANVWTEYLKTPDRVEYMAFPRMLALSEVLWTQPENKNYADFSRRLAAHLMRLDKLGVNYRIPEPLGLENRIVGPDGRAIVDLKPLIAGSKIFYTVDGSAPDERSREFTSPVTLELAPGEVKELKTIVVTPAGRKSSIYAATFVRREPLSPVEPAEKRQGVRWEFFIPAGDLSGEGTRTTGDSRSIQLSQFEKGNDLKKPFAVTFDGYLNAPSDGIYELQVDSTWDTTVVLGGEMIINDAGNKDRKVRSTIIPLKAGLHRISLRYNHRGGDAAFRVLFGLKGQGLNRLYGGELFH